MDIAISNRGLWHIITGRSSLQEPEQVEEELNENRKKLVEGILWYKQPSASSLEKLQKSDKIKPKRKELVKKLSKLLNLDEWQSLELFGSYLENEFRGSNQQLQLISRNETQTENLITKIQEYYFEERLHSLQCLKYLLSYWQDPQHAFREEFAECIEKLQEKDVLINKVIEQYKMCSTSHIEASQTYNSPLERTRNSRLAWQYLREQVLLLEIIFLYYKEYLHPSKSLLQMAKLFQSQGFGTKQVNRHLLDVRAESLIARISYLQVLILVESLNLEGVRNLMDTGNFKQHRLVQEPGGIELLDRFFIGWGDLPQHGPVMLAWAVFRYVTMETDQEQDIRRIGSKALQCHVFEFFDGLLKSESFSGMTPVSNTCKSVVYGLLFIVLTMFQEDTLGDTKLLVSVLSQTLSERGLCIDFWDTSLDTGAGLLLKSACNNFPLQFSPLLELLKSLAGEENSAAKVFEYLDNMPSYTELLRENKVGDVDCTGDDQVWKIEKPKPLYKTVRSHEQPLVIPRQTLGILLPAMQGSAVIRWNFGYSSWKLFVFEIDSFLQSVSLGAGLREDNIIAIVDLTNEILKNNWSKAEQLEPIISRLYSIVQRCAPSPNLPQNLIASCLSCLATVASHHPLQVWFSLQQTGFLPHCTSAQSIDDNKSTIESMSIAPGNVGVILTTKEQPLGQYPITMSTLRLFLQLMCGIGQAQEETEQPVNFLDLAACLVFVLREVFTGFQKWKFTAAKDREEIGQRSLEIFNAVLGLELKRLQQKREDEMDLGVSEARQQIRSASVLQDVLAFSLLNTAAGQSLLNILGTGVDTVDRLVSLGGTSGGYALAVVQLIKLAFSVLNKLLARKHKDEVISPLEQALSTQVIHQFKDSSNVYSSSASQSHLVTVIASYIHHRADCRLPTLATLLLKRLCMVAPMSMYASFGSEAVALRDVFVSRLRSLTEDVKLKIAILEFIATAVETQPGLIELFLNLKEKDKNSQEFTLGDRSCLHAVLSMVDPTKQSRLPAALVSSAFMLLHALWFDRRDAALTAIRTSEGFWQFLMQPLFVDFDIEEQEEHITSPHLQTCSYAFQILALETYYVSSGQLDAGMKSSLKTFATKQRYQYWSSLLKSNRFQEAENTSPTRPVSPLFFKSSENEYLRLLRSWRSLLVVASTIESDVYGLRDAKTRNEILQGTLEALKIKVSRPVTLDVLAAAHELSSLYLMLFNKWKSSVKIVSSTFNKLVDILEAANNNDVQLLEHIRIPVFSAISILFQHTRSNGNSDKLDSGYSMALLPLACEPLEYLNGRLGTEDKKHDKVLELSVFIIDEILNILLSNPGQWLPVLREHALFASLVQALDVCVKTKEKLEFSEAVLHLFLSLSRIPVSAEALALNNLSHTLCLGVASLFNALEAENHSEGSHPARQTTSIHVSDSNGVTSSRNDWTKVWHLSLAVMASMLRTLRHGFLKEALDFAGVHRERLGRAMDMIRASQSTQALQEAEDVTVFLFELGHFTKEWRFALSDVQELLLTRVGVLCQTCIALLTHPRLLAHLLEMSAGNPLQKGSQPLSYLSQSLSSSFSARELLRTYSYADEDTFRNNPVVSNTQTKLLKILCNSLAMLRQFAPDICEILLDEGMDIEEYMPIATLGFSSPAIDREEPLSFGTLLACLNMCLTNLSPGDVRSPVKSPVKTLSETLPKFLLMFAMENALVLVLSQAFGYLRDPSVDPRVKQLLKRELGSELGHFLGGLNRHFVRRGMPPSPLSERTSPSTSSKKTPTKPPAFSEAPEQKFFKLAEMYVKKLLR